VTRDQGDFVTLTRLFAETRQLHAGLVLVPRSIRDDDFTGIVTALATLDNFYPDGVPNYSVLYLRVGSDDEKSAL
jgi:hypothetical protein